MACGKENDLWADEEALPLPGVWEKGGGGRVWMLDAFVACTSILAPLFSTSASRVVGAHLPTSRRGLESPKVVHLQESIAKASRIPPPCPNVDASLLLFSFVCIDSHRVP